MEKAENIAIWTSGAGFVLVGAGIWIGEGNPGLAYLLWAVGIPLALVGIAILFAVGAVALTRSALRATGVLATPVEPAVPKPGWSGWVFTLDEVWHEVWIDDTGVAPRILCDGAWAETTRSDNATSFRVGQRPATVTGRVDWRTTAAAFPLVVGAALLSGGLAGTEPLPMLYDLAVDGTRVPDGGRLVIGQDGAPKARTTAPNAGTEQGANELAEGVVTFSSSPEQPGRRLHLDPPR
jgi:hypothetical protein